MLNAFGRTLSQPSTVENGKAKFTVPSVRVPVVFAIVAEKDPKRTFGELVAYPTSNAKWDGNVAVYSLSVPVWFDQWCAAVGVPVQQLKTDGGEWPRPRNPEGKNLLVLGTGAAGKGLPELAQAIGETPWHVLVLEASWHGEKGGKVTVGPPQMAGSLGGIRQEKWSSDLEFGTRFQPTRDLCNRWAWIDDGNGGPLVEQVGLPGTARRVLVSYLPWQQQLGRRDVADLTLQRILLSAGARTETVSWRAPRLLYPEANSLTRDRRPVLAGAFATSAKQESIPGAYMLDLRGRDDPPAALAEVLHAYEKSHDDSMPLLILGDCPLLDEWRWLKLERDKNRPGRSGVVWMPEDTLPPPAQEQVRLMLKLSELCIPLKEPLQEKDK